MSATGYEETAEGLRVSSPLLTAVARAAAGNDWGFVLCKRDFVTFGGFGSVFVAFLAKETRVLPLLSRLLGACSFF